MVRFKSVTYGNQTSDCDDLGIGTWIWAPSGAQHPDGCPRWRGYLSGVQKKRRRRGGLLTKGSKNDMEISRRLWRSTWSKLAAQISNRPKLFCDGLQESLS